MTEQLETTKSITPTTIESLPSLPAAAAVVVVPSKLTKKQINALQMNAASNIRRVLSNILLVLFRYHPHGVFESELETFYHDTSGEFIWVNEDLKYLLFVHRSITVTTTKTRGVLYTLNPNGLTDMLESVNPAILQIYLIEHILKIFHFFPSGIAVDCFDKTFENLLQFKLSNVIPAYTQLISCIPHIIFANVQGLNIFVNTFDISRLNQFDAGQTLTKPAGYPQLFDCINTEHDLNPQQFENAFLLKYQSRICSEAPYISGILLQMGRIQSEWKKTDGTDTERKEFNETDSYAKNNSGNKSPFFEDHCSVFLGGFCRGTTIADIKKELDAMDFVVIKCTEMKFRKFGFSWVTLSDTKEADKLIKLSPIKIRGTSIDVRPFINRDKQKQKPNDKIILATMITFLSKNENKKNGLSIRDIQPILFKQFSYRISGTDLTEIVKSNPKHVFIEADENGTEKIFVS